MTINRKILFDGEIVFLNYNEEEDIYYPTNYPGFAFTKEETREIITKLETYFEIVTEEEIETFNTSLIARHEKAKEEHQKEYKRSEMPKAKSKSGYVYLISDNQGYYKIGMSKDPEQRLKQLTISCQELNIIHKIKTNDMKRLEREMQRKYKGKRVKGEWFELDKEEVKKFIESGETIQYAINSQIRR